MYLSNNLLDTIPEWIGQLTKLVFLELGNNKLTSLPEGISNLDNLIELYLGGNNFSDLEKVRIQKLLPHCVVDFDEVEKDWGFID